MNIGIDARSLFDTPTGVGRYLLNLLRHLPQLDGENAYRLYVDRPLDRTLVACRRFCQQSLTLPFAQNALTWSQARLPWELLRRPPGLFHFPFHTIPLVRNYRSVVSIHDITYEVRPEWYPVMGRAVMSLLTRYAARHADAIMTCSEASKADICRFYGVPEDKVHVIYYAVEERFTRRDDPVEDATVRAKYGITAPVWVLYVGTIHDRRNVEQLIRAFQIVQRRAPETQLVLVGKREYLSVDLDALVKELGLEGRVRFTSYVDDEDLPALYNAADLFVYPSSYEGFGFPPLEAMACGTPVVTGRNSSLLEVAGDAAVLIEPQNIGELADAMREVLENRALAADLSQRGMAQARKFSWAETSRATLEVYRALGAS